MAWMDRARERFSANRSGTLGALALVALVAVFMIYMVAYQG